MENDQVLSDFRRRWEETYVWLKMKSKAQETLVYVRSVEYDENRVGVLHLESIDYGSITINFGSADHSLLFKYPKTGVFQRGGHAGFFRRRPQRQWRRGLCSDNGRIASVTAQVTGNMLSFNAETVRAAFVGKTYTKDQALAALAAGMAKSVALSDNLSLSLSFTANPDYVIFFWDMPVGRMNKEGKITQIFDDVMKEPINKVLG